MNADKMIDAAKAAIDDVIAQFESLDRQEKYRCWQMLENFAAKRVSEFYEPEYLANHAQELFVGKHIGV